MVQSAEKTAVGKRIKCEHCGAIFIVIKAGNIPSCGGTKLQPA